MVALSVKKKDIFFPLRCLVFNTQKRLHHWKQCLCQFVKPLSALHLNFASKSHRSYDNNVGDKDKGDSLSPIESFYFKETESLKWLVVFIRS